MATGFEDLGAVEEPKAQPHGFEDLGAAAEFKVFDERDGIAFNQDVAVGVLNDTGGFRRSTQSVHPQLPLPVQTIAQSAEIKFGRPGFASQHIEHRRPRCLVAIRFQCCRHRPGRRQTLRAGPQPRAHQHAVRTQHPRRCQTPPIRNTTSCQQHG